MIAGRMRPLVFALAVALASAGFAIGQQAKHLGRSLAEWRVGLDSPQQIDRLLAARSIGEMALAGQPGAKLALFAALEHADGAVRYWAAVATAQLEQPGDAGSAALHRLLSDEVPENRVQAAVALIRADDEPEALATLRNLLIHPNRGVRLHAVHAADALGERAKALADTLRQALDDDFDYVQRVARHALWALGERPCPYRSCE